jgi:hypothetical protein
MDNDWGWDARPEADIAPYEQVVPAVGDPEVPLYLERMRRGRAYRPRSRFFDLDGSSGLARHASRWGLALAAIVALALLAFKPLLALTAILVGLLVTFVVLGLLAVGALALAVRFALGGRYPYDTFAGAGGRGLWQRLAVHTLRRVWTRLARTD